ncbi:hypothetical protein [Streptomyces sp. NBC_00005]|uniref:hypothetical protein n=1 Tax=Streptomyces sp. NBC_00005 TaxID=2903609 RepID=UPI0032567A5E
MSQLATVDLGEADVQGLQHPGQPQSLDRLAQGALAGITGIWLDRGIDFVTGGPSPTADETVPRIEQLTDLPNHLSPTNT